LCHPFSIFFPEMMLICGFEKVKKKERGGRKDE
jgi:hypothetical protein